MSIPKNQIESIASLIGDGADQYSIPAFLEATNAEAAGMGQEEFERTRPYLEKMSDSFEASAWSLDLHAMFTSATINATFNKDLWETFVSLADVESSHVEEAVSVMMGSAQAGASDPSGPPNLTMFDALEGMSLSGLSKEQSYRVFSFSKNYVERLMNLDWVDNRIASTATFSLLFMDGSSIGNLKRSAVAGEYVENFMSHVNALTGMKDRLEGLGGVGSQLLSDFEKFTDGINNFFEDTFGSAMAAGSELYNSAQLYFESGNLLESMKGLFPEGAQQGMNIGVDVLTLGLEVAQGVMDALSETDNAMRGMAIASACVDTVTGALAIIIATGAAIPVAGWVVSVVAALAAIGLQIGKFFRKRYLKKQEEKDKAGNKDYIKDLGVEEESWDKILVAKEGEYVEELQNATTSSIGSSNNSSGLAEMIFAPPKVDRVRKMYKEHSSDEDWAKRIADGIFIPVEAGEGGYGFVPQLNYSVTMMHTGASMVYDALWGDEMFDPGPKYAASSPSLYSQGTFFPGGRSMGFMNKTCTEYLGALQGNWELLYRIDTIDLEQQWWEYIAQMLEFIALPEMHTVNMKGLMTLENGRQLMPGSGQQTREPNSNVTIIGPDGKSIKFKWKRFFPGSNLAMLSFAQMMWDHIPNAVLTAVFGVGRSQLSAMLADGESKWTSDFFATTKKYQMFLFNPNDFGDESLWGVPRPIQWLRAVREEQLRGISSHPGMSKIDAVHQGVSISAPGGYNLVKVDPHKPDIFKFFRGGGDNATRTQLVEQWETSVSSLIQAPGAPRFAVRADAANNDLRQHMEETGTFGSFVPKPSTGLSLTFKPPQAPPNLPPPGINVLSKNNPKVTSSSSEASGLGMGLVAAGVAAAAGFYIANKKDQEPS